MPEHKKMPEHKTIIVKKPNFSDVGIATFLPEIVKGMIVCNRHFFSNLIGMKYVVTRFYPEEKHLYARRYRGLHRLMKREDGSVRCVACMLCATNCPAKCITIEPAEHPDKRIEKYPAKFEINLLLCIFCGFCEEACPCDAIRLDTGVHAPISYDRKSHLITKEELLSRGSLSTSKQGGESFVEI